MATNLVDEFPDDDFPISLDDYHGIASKFEEEEVFPSTSHTKCPSNEENTNVIPCTSSYNEKLLERLLAHLDHKMKVSKNSKQLLTEILRIYSLEIITRAGDQATKEGSSKIGQEHLEKVLPQFLLDFN